MSDVQESLRVSLATLQQASAADMAGEGESALTLYVSAAARLEALLPTLPPAHSDVVHQHLDGIKQRANALRSDKTSKHHASSSYPAFPLQFQNRSIPLDECRHSVPHATVLRPYWLMRTISKSMQQGAFITPDLYVSKEVWYQDGATTVVTFVGPKVRLLTAVCELLEPLQRVTSLSEEKKVLKVLDAFLAAGDEYKSAFDTEVGKPKGGNQAIAQRSKMERGVWEFLHKGQSMLKSWKSQQDASYNAYVAWSVNVLEQAQLLDRWTQYFLQAEAVGMPEVLERLHNASAFLYFTVCSFLIQDMMLLTERFMEKSRESVSRFMPVDVRVDD